MQIIIKIKTTNKMSQPKPVQKYIHRGQEANSEVRKYKTEYVQKSSVIKEIHNRIQRKTVSALQKNIVRYMYS